MSSSPKKKPHTDDISPNIVPTEDMPPTIVIDGKLYKLPIIKSILANDVPPFDDAEVEVRIIKMFGGYTPWRERPEVDEEYIFERTIEAKIAILFGQDDCGAEEDGLCA